MKQLVRKPKEFDFSRDAKSDVLCSAASLHTAAEHLPERAA
jgi:hypothetical protein